MSTRQQALGRSKRWGGQLTSNAGASSSLTTFPKGPSSSSSSHHHNSIIIGLLGVGRSRTRMVGREDPPRRRITPPILQATSFPSSPFQGKELLPPLSAPAPFSILQGRCNLGAEIFSPAAPVLSLYRLSSSSLLW